MWPSDGSALRGSAEWGDSSTAPYPCGDATSLDLNDGSAPKNNFITWPFEAKCTPKKIGVDLSLTLTKEQHCKYQKLNQGEVICLVMVA